MTESVSYIWKILFEKVHRCWSLKLEHSIPVSHCPHYLEYTFDLSFFGSPNPCFILSYFNCFDPCPVASIPVSSCSDTLLFWSLIFFSFDPCFCLFSWFCFTRFLVVSLKTSTSLHVCGGGVGGGQTPIMFFRWIQPPHMFHVSHENKNSYFAFYNYVYSWESKYPEPQIR